MYFIYLYLLDHRSKRSCYVIPAFGCNRAKNEGVKWCNANVCVWNTRGERALVCVDIPAAADEEEEEEEDEDCPQLLRTRSDASFVQIQRRSKTRSARDLQRLRTHRFSINGHFYNHKVGERERTLRAIAAFPALLRLQVSRGRCFLFSSALNAVHHCTKWRWGHSASPVCVGFEQVPAGRISLLLPFQNIQSVPGITKLMSQYFLSSLLQMCWCLLLFPPDICVHSSIRLSHQRTGQQLYDHRTGP